MHDRPDLTGKSLSEAGRASNIHGEKQSQVATYLGKPKSDEKKGAYNKFKSLDENKTIPKSKIELEEEEQKIYREKDSQIQ